MKTKPLLLLMLLLLLRLLMLLLFDTKIGTNRRVSL
jgi:hypothetical protein